MKRKLLILLLVVAIGSGAYVYINEKMLFTEAPPVITKKKVSSKAAATSETKKTVLSGLPALFPSGLIIWIHLKDFGKVIRQVEKSNFYKQAEEYKIIDPSKSFPINVGIATKEKSAFTKISSQLEKKILTDFFGQEIGLALYPPDKTGTSNYLFAAKINAITKIQEKLQRVKNSLFGERITVVENNYKEKTIITYKNQEQKYFLHYVLTKDYLLGSSSDVLLKNSLDLIEKNGNDLFINSEEFKSIFKTSDLSLNGLFLADIEKITPNILSKVISSKNVSPEALINAKEELKAFKYLGVTLKIQKGLEIKSTLAINKEKADQKLLQTVNTEPGELKSLSFTPGNTIIYGANIFEPTLFFEQFTKGFEKEGTKKTSGEFFNKFIGVDIKKDIIPFVGNEFFYSVSAQGQSASLPIPSVTIGLELKDTEKIKNILEKIQTNLAKSSKQKSSAGKSYKGYNVNILPIPIPIPIRPGYSIIDNFLLFSVDQRGIERFIDTLKGKTPSLQKDKKYISANIPLKNNGMFFANASNLWKSLSEIIIKSPAGLPLTRQGQYAEKGIKSLDLLRVVQSFNSVFMYENNQINFRTFIALKDIPKLRTNRELLAFLEKSRRKAVPVQVQQASYNYVYNPTGKRDPFRSLITGRQIKKKKLVQFFERIKELKPINLYIYNKVRKKDPVLYKKLKSQARFFRNKKTLEQASPKERAKRLKEYKQLISIAKTNFRDTILGPLQSSSYVSLKLTGIIWSKSKRTVLIETLSGKGFSVEVNDLVGPNYGVVKKIEKDKIVVVEKYVTYTGKIIEKRQEIKLTKSEEHI